MICRRTNNGATQRSANERWPSACLTRQQRQLVKQSHTSVDVVVPLCVASRVQVQLAVVGHRNTADRLLQSRRCSTFFHSRNETTKNNIIVQKITAKSRRRNRDRQSATCCVRSRCYDCRRRRAATCHDSSASRSAPAAARHESAPAPATSPQ